MTEATIKNDFSKGSVVGNILSLALPMTLAQLINILYNIVDRMYLGRIPGTATLSLTGLGLCMPIISVIIAFANLFGTGGAPLCSIARGKGDLKEAEKIVEEAEKKAEAIMIDVKKRYDTLASRYKNDYKKWQQLQDEIHKLEFQKEQKLSEE